MDIKDFVQLIKEREAELCHDSLAFPARTFEAYMERVGRYNELQEMIDRVIKAEHEDDEA